MFARKTESQVRTKPEPATVQSLKTDCLRLKKPRVKGESQYTGFEETEFTAYSRQLIRDWEAVHRTYNIWPLSRKERNRIKKRQENNLLSRTFLKGSFDHGGRYTGWWMELNAERRRLIRIDDEACVELDFRCSSPRLALALEGIAVDHDLDLYNLYNPTGKKISRFLIKAVFTQLLATRNPNPPPGMTMPPSMDFHHLTQMIERRYPELEPWFRMGRISEIERVESDIASLVMEIFTYDLKRPVLPVHDSFIVAQQDEQVLALAMGYAFHKTIKAWTGINAWPCIHGMSDSDLRTHVYEHLFRLR